MLRRQRLLGLLAIVVLLSTSLFWGDTARTEAQAPQSPGPSGPAAQGQGSGPGTLPPQPRVPGGPPLELPPQARPERVCNEPAATGVAQCHARVWVDANGRVVVNAVPRGYSPADLQAAYKLPSSTAGSGQTVAIVDAYDDPYAESELQTYRSQFGLPPCTSQNGCFRKVNQNGDARPLPRPNAGWAQEIALDLQMVSAICPNCKILLVEASSNRFDSLGSAVQTAARLGAHAISNSYGAGEWDGETSYESPYNQVGRAVTVSSGDSGFGVQFPAASGYVTAVGGTSLVKDSSSRGWAETAWSGAGSGCSAYIGRPTWQTDNGCSRRTVADVSAVADPATGVAVYSRYAGGWTVFGGTSVAAPIIASVYALAGNTSQITAGSYPYGYIGSLFDVTSGSNGSCGGTYLCTGVVGYDGPTGLGTPNGPGGF
jgi:subtilase family serine protease